LGANPNWGPLPIQPKQTYFSLHQKATKGKKAFFAVIVRSSGCTQFPMAPTPRMPAGLWQLLYRNQPTAGYVKLPEGKLHIKK
jgi:hypothetical protein